jgi:hypothetical protein
MAASVTMTSIIACPECGTQHDEVMPEDACQFFYRCRGCGATLRPKAGDCCVFGSYGSAPARRSSAMDIS